MEKAHLHASITNTKISTLVEIAAKISAEDPKLKLGDVCKHVLQEAGVVLETKVWGFTRDRAKLILEVLINGVSVNKVVLGSKGSSYRIATNPHFISDYKRRTGLLA